MGLFEIKRLAHFRRRDCQSVGFSQGSNALERFPPGVQPEIECAVVDRNQPSAVQVEECLNSFLGLHVDIRPLGVVGTGFQQRDIEGSVFGAYLFESRKIARVATEENPQVLVQYHPGRPQGLVPVPHAAPRKVLRGRGDETHSVQLALLPPVELPRGARSWSVDALRLTRLRGHILGHTQAGNRSALVWVGKGPMQPLLPHVQQLGAQVCIGGDSDRRRPSFSFRPVMFDV